MFSNKLIAGAGLCCLLLTGAWAQDATESAPAEPCANDPVAVVNGYPISQELCQAYVRQRQQRRNTPPSRQTILDELVMQALLAQQAKQQNLDEDPQVRGQLALVQHTVLASAAASEVISDYTPTEEAIQQQYDTSVEAFVAAAPAAEYKARHILVETEEQAQALIEQLQAEDGENFSELAKTHSTDASKDEGGDLGWFTPDLVDPAFAEAVTGLEKGDFTQTPVQTQFGWHVILLEDKRAAAAPTPPPLEDVRPQIVQRLRNQALREHLDKLRSDADIEIP